MPQEDNKGFLGHPFISCVNGHLKVSGECLLSFFFFKKKQIETIRRIPCHKGSEVAFRKSVLLTPLRAKLWRRQWQPSPVFLPGESQGWGSLVGCRLWGRTELDTTEATQQQQQQSKTEAMTNADYTHILSVKSSLVFSWIQKA